MGSVSLVCPVHGKVFADLPGRQVAGALSPVNHDVWVALVEAHEDCHR